MKKRNDQVWNRWRAVIMSDWPFVGGALAASALIGPALILAPTWRAIILGCAAATVLGLLGLERARARRRMQRLANQLKAVASLDKFEVPDDPSAAALDQALNDAIQRSREQARILKLVPQSFPPGATLGLLADTEGKPRNVAVLALGLRDQDQPAVSPEAMQQLRDIAASVVRIARRRSALLQMQGSGTFALIFAALSQEPAARSAKEAFDAATELITLHPTLRVGMSVGTGLPCTLPGAGYTVLGTPFEEAVRLHRLAASWSEYSILCPEPVALLLRPRTTSQRTHLQLTSPTAPPLPVYSLETTHESIALGA